MADITVDVDLPSIINVDVSSPTQAVGANVYIAGPQGPRGPGSNINGLTPDYFYITGKDGITVFSNGIDIIYVSGNSGYFQSAVTSLSNNINSLSGLFTGHTGDLNASYATDFELASTGSTLNTKIDNLSGYLNSQDTSISNNLISTGYNLYSMVTGFSGNLDANYATDLQLFNTGSALDSKVNFLSGYINSSNSNIVFTTGNQNISGRKIFFDPAAFSTSQTEPFILSNNPLSVVGSGDYYLQLNIQNRGTGLSASSDLVLTSDNGTEISNYIDLGINSSKYNNGDIYSLTTGNDGYLYINGGNLVIGTQTDGKVIKFHVNGSETGDQVAEINTNGVIAANLVYNTTDQNINGVKNFLLRPTVNGTGVLLSGEAALPITIVYTTGNQTISGVKTFTEISCLKNATLSGDVINKNYADQNLVYYIDNTLSNNTNLNLSFPTGLTGIRKINYTLRQPSGFGWGVNYNSITWLTSAPPNPTFTDPVVFEYYPLGPNSTQSYGIYINAIANLEKNRSTIVYTTGNQTISGDKTFVNNINVSGTGIFNSLDLNNIDNLSLSGVDITITSGVVSLTNPLSAPNLVYNTGNQTISGVKTFANSGIFSLSGIVPLTVPNNPLSVVGSGNSYVQVNIQNRATGTTATADLVITANNGTDSANFINLGINNSGYNDPTFSNGSGLDGYLFVNGGSLDIGTATPNTQIEFHVGGTTAARSIARIDQSGINILSGTYRVNNIPYNTFTFTLTHSSSTLGSGFNYFGLNDAGYSSASAGSRRRMPILETCQIRKASWSHLAGTVGSPVTILSTGYVINTSSNPRQTGIISTVIDSSADAIPNHYITDFSPPINVTSGDLIVAALVVTGFSTAPLSVRDTVILYCYN